MRCGALKSERTDGSLAGWDVNARTALSLDQLTSGSGELALYRPANVNQEGGPTKNDGAILFGELTNPIIDDLRGSNKYNRIMGDPENTLASISLPPTWFIGNHTHIEINSTFAGMNPGLDSLGFGAAGYTAASYLKKAGDITGNKLIESLGGYLGVFVLTIDIARCTTWDTSYTIQAGQGHNMPRTPVPEPP